ncbi:hypothetical protein AG1IA_03289 [Rhizoctonia solani AG-1 IA]|uniref:Uncharacterized protein n=1 Tax=Thanatephorus cucumeris (strain AG1-IA) TaxID=983506 RepID=L8WXF2_THACA|nr:hypothetical protein AG1IA_03289 [Rhizoctonia solani AG-1 IA]
MNGSRFTLGPIMDSIALYVRYATEETSSVVNTNHFTLSDMNGTNFSQLFNEQPDPNVASHGSGGSGSDHTNQSISSTLTTANLGHSSEKATGFTRNGNAPTSTGVYPLPTSSMAGFTNGNDQGVSQTGGPIGPLGAPPMPTVGDTDDSQQISTDSQSGAISLTRQRDSAWRKLSLALWPVLVGAMMAM